MPNTINSADSKKTSPGGSKTGVMSPAKSQGSNNKSLEAIKSNSEVKKEVKKTSAVLIATPATSTPHSAYVEPRPGGYIKILVPPQTASIKNKESNNELSPCICLSSLCQELAGIGAGASFKPGTSGKDITFGVSSHDTTREYRINKTINELDWDIASLGDLNFDVEFDEAAEVPIIPKINLVSVLISFIMMTASGNDVSESEVRAIVSYLDCIRDDEDVTPPNVQGLLNHIHMKYGVKGKGGNKRTTISPKKKQAEHIDVTTDNDIDNTNVMITSTLRVKPSSPKD